MSRICHWFHPGAIKPDRRYVRSQGEYGDCGEDERDIPRYLPRYLPTGAPTTDTPKSSTPYQASPSPSGLALEEEGRKAKEGDLEAVENLVWLVGTVEGDWTGRKDFAMKELGLGEEDLERVVRRTVEKLG